MSYSKTENEYFDREDEKRLARLLMLSRAESGLSQERVALEMGIAKKTVQNWERGVSAPSLPQAVEWFKIMGISAMPYFLQYMFPDMEGIKGSDKDSKIRKELHTLIDNLPIEGVRQLMFLFYGNHGSSPRAVLNMITAHLQTPLLQRYSHACQILADYKLANETGKIVKPDHIKPNIELLEHAISQSKNSIVKEKNTYSLLSSK